MGWNFDLQKASIGMHFFKGGKTNMSYNCLDRHVKRGHGDRTCFFWEGNEYDEDRQMSYREVLQEVSRVVSSPQRNPLSCRLCNFHILLASLHTQKWERYYYLVNVSCLIKTDDASCIVVRGLDLN